MKKLSTSVERWVSNHFPNAYLRIVQGTRNYFRFKIERRLLKGESLSSSDHPSILFFTTQKCASRYVDKILGKLTTSAGLIHADYDAYAAMVRVPKDERLFTREDKMQVAFKSKGYYYGPLGTFRKIPNLSSYRIVLQLRDPRDVLTSLYYSTAFSHALISPKLLRRRMEAREMDVDSYVLHAANEYLPIYQEYSDSLLGREGVGFLRYEDMVADFPTWLDRLSSHTGLSTETVAIHDIRNAADFTVKEEDIYAQRRQVTPGDYLRKLQPETIKALNIKFGGILDKFGYKAD
jgi:hypothetical protein